MAGFQQAANAITGAYGTIAGRVGIYNELVGKNKEQKEQLAKQNEELNKKNEEIADQYEALKEMRSDAQLELDEIYKRNTKKKWLGKKNVKEKRNTRR